MKFKPLSIITVLVVIGIALYSCASYNRLVESEENVKQSLSQVQTVYQRRLDLVPNLVSTVQGYAKHESELLTALTQTRAGVGGRIEISGDMLNDPDALRRFEESQRELGGALSRLLAVSESYPDLKSNENFLALQNQLEGTENRISVELGRFNEAVEGYNVLLRRFPSNLIAGVFGFTAKNYFAAEPGAEKAPKVSF